MHSQRVCSCVEFCCVALAFALAINNSAKTANQLNARSPHSKKTMKVLALAAALTTVSACDLATLGTQTAAMDAKCCTANNCRAGGGESSYSAIDSHIRH